MHSQTSLCHKPVTVVHHQVREGTEVLVKILDDMRAHTRAAQATRQVYQISHPGTGSGHRLLYLSQGRHTCSHLAVHDPASLDGGSWFS
eukprot:6202862-Pleurochrysis_carterae.AAC.2